MPSQAQGQLVPVGGGDPIPLEQETLMIGRRESCDICLPFPNISGLHCELTFRQGYWTIRDLNSKNGIKVNGERVLQRPLRPGDEIAIAKRTYKIEYVMPEAAREALANLEEDDEAVMRQSLLEKAGLVKRRPTEDDD